MHVRLRLRCESRLLVAVARASSTRPATLSAGAVTPPLDPLLAVAALRPLLLLLLLLLLLTSTRHSRFLERVRSAHAHARRCKCGGQWKGGKHTQTEAGSLLGKDQLSE